MILRIIDETEKALSHDLYFAALNLALTLPDICGKAEYYKENKDKFDFYNYELIDWDEVTAPLPPIDMEEVFRKLADPNLS